MQLPLSSLITLNSIIAHQAEQIALNEIYPILKVAARHRIKQNDDFFFYDERFCITKVKGGFTIGCTSDLIKPAMLVVFDDLRAVAFALVQTYLMDKINAFQLSPEAATLALLKN
jgi:hypothetical protein